MWKLEAYNKITDELACEHPLPRLDGSDVRTILKIYDDEPIEPFTFDANDPAALNALIKFSDGPIEINPDFSYFLGFS
ncbi:hypothetical protein [Mycobacterium sp. NPDC050441]|uniref:DUF7683 domain-containing protein n=1 Tax=Mycobacterium sp. NPDC050441 TaxID=3155403 RepID=UPI0033F255F8